MVFIRDEDGKKLGEGAYGHVYPGEVIYSTGKKERGAQKQTFHYHEYSGFGSLREIQILHTLSSKSPFAPRLLAVFFDEYKRKPRGDDLIKIEGINFVTEIMSSSAEKFFGTDQYNFNDAIDMIGQLITGVAFMHDRLITHRDIKPANILVSLDRVTMKPHLKICDFGFSQFLVNSAPSTPGTNTAWYRAPEICWNIQKYGATSDVWATGCTIYEILTGKVLFKVESEDSHLLFHEILRKNPNAWREEIHASYERNSQTILKVNGLTEKQTLPPGPQLIDSFRSSKYYNQDDSEKWNELSNMIKLMLDYKYKVRIPCYNLLQNPLFSSTRETYRDIVKNLGETKNIEEIFISLPDDLHERKVNFFKNFINVYYLFTKRVLFHAIDLANRILAKIDVFDPVDRNVEKICVSCIYFYHKYWLTLKKVYPISKFFNKISEIDLDDPANIEEYYKYDKWVFDFEICLIKNIFPGFKFYRPGIFEMIDEYPSIILSEDDIKKLLIGFVEVKSLKGCSFRRLYRQLYNSKINPEYVFPTGSSEKVNTQVLHATTIKN